MPAASTSPSTPSRRVGTFGIGLAIITVVGLAGRVTSVLATRGDTDLCGFDLCGDALWYSAQAHVIGRGHGFTSFTDHLVPTADHPPLTPLVLAPISAVLGGDTSPVTAQRLMMALLGAAVIVAMGFLGRKVGGRHGTGVGLLAAGIAALNANFWMNDIIVMSETIGTLGIVVVLLLVYRFVDRPSIGRAAAVGVVIGVTMLARAELALLLPVTFAPMALWARDIGVRARIGRIALAGVCVLAVLLPWTVYNIGRFDKPVLISTNDGLTLVGANCDDVYGVNDPGGIGFWSLRCAEVLRERFPVDADQSVVAAGYREIGIDYITDHKRLVPKVIAYRIGRALGVYAPADMTWLNQGEGRSQWGSWVGMVQWYLLVPVAVAGAVVLRRRRVPIWPLASTAIVVLITVVAFYGIVRFRLPLDVAVVVLAAVAIDALVRRLRGAPDEPSAVDADTPIGAGAGAGAGGGEAATPDRIDVAGPVP
jgi:4-amino-4-deoxy-L-arabinose transferase-like glycosyltransferase